MSEVECLATRDGCFTVFRMATIHPEILVPVHGLDLQVNLDLAILKVDSRVQKSYLLGRPGSSELNSQVVCGNVRVIMT